jgi:hypothetical protein
MSLWIALPCGVGAAIAYGASTAVEHAAAHAGTAPDPAGPNTADPDAGAADARGLLALVRNPRWLLGMAGDTLGLILQIAALATGPVVLIQPLLVLALPISLPISRLLGGRRATAADYRSCALIIAGLAVFFAIVGNPGDASVLTARPAVIVIAVALVAGGLAMLAVRGRPAAIRALVYGAVAGAWFGIVGVLLDAAAASYSAASRPGIDAFAHPAGFVPLAGLLVLGGLSVVLTQVALQIGELGASFPASLAADPVVAVVLGATLLGETVPVGAWDLVAYPLCLAVIVAGAIRLARRADR